MLKKQLLFLSIFSILSCFGQDTTHVDAYLKDSYFVYPFQERIYYDEEALYSSKKYIQNEKNEIVLNKFGDSSTYWIESFWIGYDDYNFEKNTPPHLDSLPDGKYVQYYSPIFYSDEDTIKFIKNRIAAVFYVKNNLPNGMAYWFDDDDQNLYKKGRYLNGKREGNWKMNRYNERLYTNQEIKKKVFRKKEILTKIDTTEITCLYLNGLKSGIQITKLNDHYIQKTPFVNGQKNGIQITNGNNKSCEKTEYLNDKKNGKYILNVFDFEIITGNYKNNEKSGEWFYYKLIFDKKKKEYIDRLVVEHFIINDEKTGGKSVIIRHQLDKIKNTNYSGVSGISSGYSSISWCNINSEDSGIKSWEGYDFERYYSKNDTTGYIFKYKEYEKYYYPGNQLYLKFKTENGNLVTDNDTVFWKNGQPMNILIYNPKIKQYEQKFIDSLGVEVETLIYDSLGNEIRYKIINGNYYFKSYYKKDEYKYNLNEKIPKISNDTTILIYEYRNKDCSKILEQSTYNPKLRIGKKQVISNYEINSSFEFDPNFKTSQYNEKISIDKLSIISSKSDSLKNRQAEGKNWEIDDYSFTKEMITNGYLNPEYKTFFYNEKLFTGKIIVHVKGSDIKIKKRINRIHFYYPIKNKDDFNLFFPSLTSFVSYYDYGYDYNLTSKVILPYKNGDISGIVRVKNYENNLDYIIPFQKNKINGKVLNFNTLDDSKYLVWESEYKNGEQNGFEYGFNKKGDTIYKTEYPIKPILLEGKVLNTSQFYYSITTYKNKIKNGLFTVYLDTAKIRVIGDSLKTLTLKANFINDTVVGEAFLYNSGDLMQKCTFQKGVLSDTVFTYNYDGVLTDIMLYDRDTFIKKITYTDGLISEILINNTDEKCGFPYEYSNYHNYNTLSSLYKYNKRIYGYDFANLNGYYSEYSPNGEIIKEGNYREDTILGLWKYYYPKPLGNYSINYFDTILKINDTLSFYTKGVYIQKDEKGNILSKRHIISDEMIYNCGQEETYSIVMYYIETEKDSSQHLRNGFLKNYYPTGVKQSEGMNKNGLPTGLWKFYNDNGSLRETGHYINGKKQGRWLSGDLAKINYMGDLCFDLDNEKMQELVTNLEKQLDIQETFYDKGIYISENHFYLVK